LIGGPWKIACFCEDNREKQGVTGETGSPLTGSSAIHIPDMTAYFQFPGSPEKSPYFRLQRGSSCWVSSKTLVSVTAYHSFGADDAVLRCVLAWRRRADVRCPYLAGGCDAPRRTRHLTPRTNPWEGRLGRSYRAARTTRSRATTTTIRTFFCTRGRPF